MSFAIINGLRPGDVVVTPKSFMNLVEHYVVYMGRDDVGNHWYIENNNQVGVRWINEAAFVRDNPNPTRIRRFKGNDLQRDQAVEKAKTYVGTRYNLANFNCEHLANDVQYNQAFSKQVNMALGIAGVAGLFFAAVGLAASKE